MSRAALQADTLPPTARAIALLLASTPSIQDAQPGVLHQLLEFSHRYVSQVLSDALVYAEHAGRPGKVEGDDVILAIQARVGWEFGGRVPKEYIESLAHQTNAIPLPPVSEVFGVRLPPASECLTAVDYNLVPNKPPPDVKIFDEIVEEIEESDSEEEEDTMESQEPTMDEPSSRLAPPTIPITAPITAMHTPSDVDLVGSPEHDEEEENGSDEAEDGLFAGGDEEEESEGDQAMEGVEVAATNGIKRKLVEDDEYD